MQTGSVHHPIISFLSSAVQSFKGNAVQHARSVMQPKEPESKTSCWSVHCAMEQGDSHRDNKKTCKDVTVDSSTHYGMQTPLRTLQAGQKERLL